MAVLPSYGIDIPAVIAGALTLTAALAWNEAARAGLQALYPDPGGSSFRAAFIYALVVTLVIIIVSAALQTVLVTAKPANEGHLAHAAAAK